METADVMNPKGTVPESSYKHVPKRTVNPPPKDNTHTKKTGASVSVSVQLLVIVPSVIPRVNLSVIFIVDSTRAFSVVVLATALL